MATHANIIAHEENTTSAEQCNNHEIDPITYDPLLIVIEKFNAAIDEYDSLPDEITENTDAHEWTWEPWFNVLENWDKPALTEKSAIAAINLARKQLDTFGCSEVVFSLLNAACLYFNKTR